MRYESPIGDNIGASVNIVPSAIPVRSTPKRTRSRVNSVDSVSSVQSASAGDAPIVQFDRLPPMRTRSRSNSTDSANSVPVVARKRAAKPSNHARPLVAIIESNEHDESSAENNSTGQ